MVLMTHPPPADSTAPIKREQTVLTCPAIMHALSATALASVFSCPPRRPAAAGHPPRPYRPSLPGSVDLANPRSALSVTEERKKGVPFILIEGGVAQTRRSVLRCGVDRLVDQAGAQAGVNGTFFADALV